MQIPHTSPESRFVIDGDPSVRRPGVIQATIPARSRHAQVWDAPPCRLRLEVLTNVRELEALEEAWGELDRHTYPRVPFSGPRWNLIWWRHFAESRRLVTDRIHSFAFFDNAKLVGVAPMMVTERPAGGPLRLRQLHFFGADPNLTELRGACVRREDEGRVFEALLTWLSNRQSEWDLVDLCGFGEGGTAIRAMSSRGRVYPKRRLTDFLIEPGVSWEAYRAQAYRRSLTIRSWT